MVLAASGTDTELLALALTHLSGADSPILNILIAPEETGRGVPMAARGVHFAVDTALGHAVSCEAPIAGFRADTELANVFLRDGQGDLREIGVVEAELAELIAKGIAAGRRLILHVLDLSKTRPGWRRDRHFSLTCAPNTAKNSISWSMPARPGSPPARCRPTCNWVPSSWSPDRNSSPAAIRRRIAHP